MHDSPSAARPDPDQLLIDIADYVTSAPVHSQEACDTARLCLMDSLACMMLALSFPACTSLLGPLVPGAALPNGARVPGTDYELDPVQAAFNIGALVRWLDYNDTWLAAEWGHPSDNLGAILSVADYLSRNPTFEPQTTNHELRTANYPLTIRDLQTRMIQAHEIQGLLALENAFNRVGLDHVLLVRIASTAVATAMLGGTRQQVIDALSHAFLDGGALRTYRHAPNAGPRKSWAAGDATSRAVRLALLVLRGQIGCPTALSTKTWGFYDVLFKGNRFALSRPFGSYVMEHILFKVSYPAEFHAQTAVECAVQLHPQVKDRLPDIQRIIIETQEPALRIIDKSGPLNNPADRDHCIQYMVAVPLIKGDLTADDYEDAAAADPRIDALRAKMQVIENPQYSIDYLDPEKRSIPNALQIFFTDGASTPRLEVHFPIGHRRRRQESIPLVKRKFESAVASQFSRQRTQAILHLFDSPPDLDRTPLPDFMRLWVRS